MKMLRGEDCIVTYHHEQKTEKGDPNDLNLPGLSEKPVGRDCTEV